MIRSITQPPRVAPTNSELRRREVMAAYRERNRKKNNRERWSRIGCVLLIVGTMITIFIIGTSQ